MFTVNKASEILVVCMYVDVILVKFLTDSLMSVVKKFDLNLRCLISGTRPFLVLDGRIGSSFTLPRQEDLRTDPPPVRF